MFRKRRQLGFTLIELLVVITTVLILTGTLLGVGKYLTIRASVQLCASQVEVICTALTQYYDDYEVFPFTTDTDGDGDSIDDFGQPDYKIANLLVDLDHDPTDPPSPTIETGAPLDEDASSIGLFYFLDSSPNSRKIIEALSGDLLTNKDGANVAITLRPNDGSADVDLPRFVDPWGVSLRYEYLDGAAFPVLTSAGPDKEFTTTADNITSQ